MNKGRPQKIENRTTKSVSFAGRQLDFIESSGLELSEFVRDAVDMKIESMMSPEEELENEIREKEKLIEETQAILKELHNRRSDAQKAKLLREEQERQAEVFELQRVEIFNKKFRSLIYSNQLCPVDFYGNVKKELKFEILEDAQAWLIKMYNIPQTGCKKYSVERIHTFLRIGTNLKRFW